jgi:hypothetical protein
MQSLFELEVLRLQPQEPVVPALLSQHWPAIATLLGVLTASSSVMQTPLLIASEFPLKANTLNGGGGEEGGEEGGKGRGGGNGGNRGKGGDCGGWGGDGGCGGGDSGSGKEGGDGGGDGGCEGGDGGGGEGDANLGTHVPPSTLQQNAHHGYSPLPPPKQYALEKAPDDQTAPAQPVG